MPKTSSFGARVEVFGAKEASDALLAMADRAVNTLPLTIQLVSLLADSQRERVAEAPWIPLTGETIERKAEQGENTNILRDEARPIRGTPTRKRDALYMALTHPGDPNQLRHATRTWAVFGVKAKGKQELFYARFVQNVKGKKRRLLAINATTAATCAERTASYILAGWIYSPHMTLPA